MPNYVPHPTAKTMPSRKQRKSARTKAFFDNKHMSKKYQKRAQEQKRAS